MLGRRRSRRGAVGAPRLGIAGAPCTGSVPWRRRSALHGIGRTRSLPANGSRCRGAPEDRRRHIAYGSRLANRGDLPTHRTNASGSPLAFASSHAALIANPGRPLKLAVIQRLARAARPRSTCQPQSTHDRHAWPGSHPRPRRDASGLGEDFVMTVGDLPKPDAASPLPSVQKTKARGPVPR